MDKSTVTIAEFAPILAKAFRRYCVHNANTHTIWDDKHDDIIMSIKRTLSQRLDRKMDSFTSEEPLSWKTIGIVIDYYIEKSKSYDADYYNAVRSIAWAEAAKVAFTNLPMKTPTHLRITHLAREYDGLMGDATGSQRRRQFRELAESCKVIEDGTITGKGLEKMIKAVKGKKEKCALAALYELHFMPDTEKPKAAEPVQAIQPQEAEPPYDACNEYAATFGNIIKYIIGQLKTIHDSKAVGFDKAEIEAILDAIGLDDILKENEELRAKVQELTTEAEKDKATHEKLKEILGNVRQTLKDISAA